MNKEVMKLKVSKELYIGGLGGRKGSGSDIITL